MSFSSTPNDNDDQSQPAAKKVKENHIYCFINNGVGNQIINVPSSENSSYLFNSSSAVQHVTAHLMRPSAFQGSELYRRVLMNNQRPPAQLALNQQQPRVQQGHQPLLQHALARQQQVQRVQQQVPQDESRRIFGVSSEEERARAGVCGNTLKKILHKEFSFDNFPYYLSDRTKHHLLALYFMHMKHKVLISRPNLHGAGHRVLLSGPEGSERYQEAVAIALSHQFGVKLLVFDCRMNLGDLSVFGQPHSEDALTFHLHPTMKYLSTEHVSRSIPMPSFSNAASTSSVSAAALSPFFQKSHHQSFMIGDRVIFTGLKYGSTSSVIGSRGPSFGSRGKVLVRMNYAKRFGVRFDELIPEGNDLGGVCEPHRGFFCDVNEVCKDVEAEIKPLSTPIQGFSSKSRLIVFVKHPGKCLAEKGERYQGLSNMICKLPDNVFVIGSYIQEDRMKHKDFFYRTREKEQSACSSMQLVFDAFPVKITIEMPEDQRLLDKLKCQLDRDAKLLKVSDNVALLKHVLIEHELDCEDIETLQVTDQELTAEDAEKVVKWALGWELMAYPRNNSNLKLVISLESIIYGLDNLRTVQMKQKISGVFREDIQTDEYEKRILEDVILHNEIGLKFGDIGALDDIKDTLKETVVLPLKMPELFCTGQLRKLCRGILLYGPPGTGKTMLAQAVAAEAGANFFYISVSIIAAKWNGDWDKFVKTLSSLASKISPSILYIDGVDSLFGKRKELGNSTILKMKNDFMLFWDGLQSSDAEKILVLAGTSRPSDLDEAVIRRLPCRLMVDLPDIGGRYEILKLILAKEELLEDVDLGAIIQMTNGFSGNDLKNLCIAAARHPVREIIGKLKSQVAKGKETEIRPLNMEDFKYGFDQVKGSASSRWKGMADLLQWHNLHGDGAASSLQGNSHPSYFV